MTVKTEIDRWAFCDHYHEGGHVKIKLVQTKRCKLTWISLHWTKVDSKQKSFHFKRIQHSPFASIHTLKIQLF